MRTRHDIQKTEKIDAATALVRERLPAAKAGIQPGDVLLRANSQAVPNAVALTTLLAGRKGDEDMTLDLKDRAGAAKKTDVKVLMTPRLIGLNDQSLLVNKILVDLRGRLEQPGDPLTDSVMRLNLAVALEEAGIKLLGTPADAIDRAKQETRNYAKRQISWLNNQI